MKKLISLLIVMILSVNIIGCSNTQISNSSENNQLSTKEKVEDFNQLFNTIKDGYPFLEVNKRLNDIDWVGNKDEYLERIKNTKNDEEFINEMDLIMRDLNNGHTHLLSTAPLFSFFRDTYINKGWYDFFEDETVVNRYKNMGSEEISTTNMMQEKDILTDDVVDGKVGYIYLPQMYSEEKLVKKHMTLIDDYMKNLENHQALIIDIRGNTGGDDAYWKSVVNKLMTENITEKGYILFREDSEVIKDYAYKRTGGKVSNISDLPNEVLANAPKEVSDMFTSFYYIENIMYSGFSSKFKGNIYLLVDDMVYSSAESFSIFCKETGFATLVGEKTGGDGGGFDPVIFNLDNSGLIVRMSGDMYLTGSGVCNEEFKTTPDYEVDDVTRTSDFKDDKCIQKVLNLEDLGV